MAVTRREFVQTAASVAAVAGVAGSLTASGAGQQNAASHKVRRGVATYSYQEEVMAGLMTCEDVLREISDIGAYGFELIAEMLVPDFPNPPSHWVDQWHGWVEKYHVKPVAYTQFVDTQRRNHHNLTVEEGVGTMLRDIKLAKLLGIPHIRALLGTPLDILEATLPHLEKQDIWLGVELHYPVRFDSALMARLLKLSEQSDRFGFVPDFGIFQNKPNPFGRDQMIRRGQMTAEAATYIENAWENKTDKAMVLEEVGRMNAGRGAAGYVNQVYAIAPLDPAGLMPILSKCRHIHGKTWGLDEHCVDPAIDLAPVIPVLTRGGYDGVIATEYEGQRQVQDILPFTAVEMVRRHHVMMRRLLET